MRRAGWGSVELIIISCIQLEDVVLKFLTLAGYLLDANGLYLH